jgi:hypothetical protein
VHKYRGQSKSYSNLFLPSRLHRLRLVPFLAVLLILAVGIVAPVAFADSGAVSASPSTAPPNTTIFLKNIATLTGATPTGYYDTIFSIVVLTPSGTIYIGYDLANAFVSSGPGTYECDVPYGGAAASPSVTTTGGASVYYGCSGSDSTAWSVAVSSVCTGPLYGGPDYYCVGPTDFATLSAYCTPGGTGPGGAPPSSSGDTSQPGTYQVFTCWEFTLDSSGTTSYTPIHTSFVIQEFSGVPQFPLGLFVVFAVAFPGLLLVRAKMSKTT